MIYVKIIFKYKGNKDGCEEASSPKEDTAFPSAPGIVLPPPGVVVVCYFLRDLLHATCLQTRLVQAHALPAAWQC